MRIYACSILNTNAAVNIFTRFHTRSLPALLLINEMYAKIEDTVLLLWLR